jgi:hypothetical protein
MPEFLLRMEAVNFSGFFEDTSDVSTIRGGGLLLLDAPNALNSIAGLRKVYSGASTALFRFSAPDLDAAELMRNLVENKLHEGARAEATIMVDVAQLEGNSSFKDTLDRLIALNRWRQLQTPSLVFPGINETGAIDELDDKRPAVKRTDMLAPREEDETRGRAMVLSDATFARRRYGMRQKYQFYLRTKLDIGEWQTFPFHAGDYVTDLEQLAQYDGATPRDLDGKLAYIYLDGNKFSNVARGCGTEELAHDWSERVQANQDSFLNWLVRIQAGAEPNTAWHWSGPARVNTGGEALKQRAFRIETLLWGGDEILWVVPAWCGWWVLGSFFAHYGRLPWRCGGAVPRTHFDSDHRYRLSHGAGIVFCHATAPIHRIRSLAKRLADGPKALGTNGLPTEAYTDYFAYQVLESFDHLGADPDGIRKLRMPAALQPLSPDPLILPGEGMLDIFSPMGTFRQKFPRSKIHHLVRRFLTGVPKALNDAWESASAEVERAELKDQFAALTRYFGGQARDRQIRDIITWLHIAELWDYTPPPGWSAPAVPPTPEIMQEGE